MRANWNKSEDIERQKEMILQLYRGILSQVPNFKKTIEEFGSDFESIMDLIGVVSSNYTMLWFSFFPLDGQGVPKRTPARYEQTEGRPTRILCP
jgi:hypothetical protein